MGVSGLGSRLRSLLPAVGRRAALMALGAGVGAVLAMFASWSSGAPSQADALWGAALGAVLAALIVVRSALVCRWGAVTAWAVVALGAAAVCGASVWVSPLCYQDVSGCAAASLSWSLVGVLLTVLAFLLVMFSTVARSLVRVGRRAWKLFRGA